MKILAARVNVTLDVLGQSFSREGKSKSKAHKLKSNKPKQWFLESLTSLSTR
jgi:hypothetical protein